MKTDETRQERPEPKGEEHPLRIAQVAPLFESVPPKYYGGTERVVSYLTEELVRQGHDVTLYASGDSVTSARLVAPCRHAQRLEQFRNQLVHHILMLETVARDAGGYDVIHFHPDFIHYPLFRRIGTPHVTTLHGRLDIELTRYDGDVGVNVLRKERDVEVLVLK